MPTTTRRSTKRNVLLWTVQGLLAALFLFAGGMKFVIPVAMLTKDTSFSGDFMHFIGAAEVLGALGLILPGITKIARELTAFAAVGLVMIMIGAVTTTLASAHPSQSVTPAVVGALAALVAYSRRQPIGAAPRRTYGSTLASST